MTMKHTKKPVVKNPLDTDKRKGLGRGLSALFGDSPTVAPVAPGAPDAAILRESQMMPIEALGPGRYQPRRHFDAVALDTLAQSIRDKGLLQPILVRRSGANGVSFEIIAGERRWRAAQKAQLHHVPVVVKELSDSEALEIALIENVQRQDLNVVEEATAYRRLLNDFGYTQEQVATQIGKSRSHIANMLRMLTLPKSVLALIETGALSFGHAKLLTGHPDAATLAQQIMAKGLSVREVEQLLRAPAARPKKTAAPRRGEDADARALARDLGELLGLRVTIHSEGEKGEVRIAYQTLEQLDDLCARLRGQSNAGAAEDPL